MRRPKELSDAMSDILYEKERRKQLSLLKSPPKQPKAVTVQARVEAAVKAQLELYAEFIDASRPTSSTGPRSCCSARTTTSDAGQTNTQTTTTAKELKETFLRRPSSKHEI